MESFLDMGTDVAVRGGVGLAKTPNVGGILGSGDTGKDPLG